MIDKKKYYNNLKFISALFYADLLDKDDIFKISNYLLNNSYDDSCLINICLSHEDNKNEIMNNFDLFLSGRGLFINSKEKATRILINLIFDEILNKKISFMDGMEFIIQYLVDNSKDKEFVGDYLGLERLIGVYYTMDDGDITDKNEINKTLNSGIDMIKEYKSKREHSLNQLMILVIG